MILAYCERQRSPLFQTLSAVLGMVPITPFTMFTYARGKYYLLKNSRVLPANLLVVAGRVARVGVSSDFFFLQRMLDALVELYLETNRPNS